MDRRQKKMLFIQTLEKILELNDQFAPLIQIVNQSNRGVISRLNGLVPSVIAVNCAPH